MDTAAAERQACWRCQASIESPLACSKCGAPQPLPEGTDLFAVLGLPRRLSIDVEDLESRYHAASRGVHPDRHQTAGVHERELSLALSSAVNRAHRTLRDPVARGRYWLELHGVPLGADNNRVPSALAALVFETQEKLEELGGASGQAAEELRGEVRRVREQLTSRLRGLGADLEARYVEWTANGATGRATLEELKRRLSEIAYLRTLLGDVDSALGE